MKIIKKRAFALLIDSFIFGSVVAGLQLIFPNLLKDRGILLIFLFIPFFCRDIVFGNASPGKRILGISIYSTNWEKPSLKTLILRSFCTATVVYVLLIKSKLVGGNVMAAIDWERDKIGTYVIDAKVYGELQKEAKEMNGQFPENMTELYNTYLRDLYCK